jgi:hypothetical protein
MGHMLVFEVLLSTYLNESSLFLSCFYLCKCALQAAAGIWRAEFLTNGVDLNGMCVCCM